MGKHTPLGEFPNDRERLHKAVLDLRTASNNEGWFSVEEDSPTRERWIKESQKTFEEVIKLIDSLVSQRDELLEVLRDALAAIESLDDDCLGWAMPDLPNGGMVSMVQGYPYRDELVANINAAIAKATETDNDQA